MDTQPTPSTAPRLPPLSTYPLRSLIEALKQEESWEKSGRSARTLYKANGLRLVLNCMKAGTEIKPHQANGPISVQVLQGSLTFRTETEEVRLGPMDMLSLQEHLRHSVAALEECSFLLTIGQPA